MSFKGAGGSEGGTGSFILGFLMMCAGFYLLLNAIVVTQPWGLGYGLYRFSMWGTPWSITSGMILVPLMIGVAMIFFNARNYIGWALFTGSLAALVIGVIVNINLHMRPMSLFELLGILILTLGGLGLFLRSLKAGKAAFTDEGSEG